MTDYRASFDAAISFRNGGDLSAHGFRVDVPAPGVGVAEIAALFVASLGLLMTETVELSNVEIFAESHKGTRRGPSDHDRGGAAARGRLVELSHMIRAGMITYPGLPGPAIRPYLTREASRAHYAPGTEFAVDELTLIGNTGTYLDAPYHRYPDGPDLSAIPLARTAGLPALVVRVTGAQQRAIDAGRWPRWMSGARLCCCTLATTPSSAHRLTPRGDTFSPGPVPHGWPLRARPSSASTLSTSMTSATVNGLPTRCCSPPAFPSSST